MQRPPTLDETDLTPEQQAVFDAIRSGPRGIVEGPLRVWLQSPTLADRAQALGAFCRYGTRLPSRLSELAILVTGAYWQAGFEWHVHAPIAEKAGLSPAVIEAIRTGAEPRFEDDDEALVYAFARQLHVTKEVDDDTYARAAQRFGTAGVVELVGILGYYTLISMTIKAFHVPVPEGSPEPFG
jgi:4-carboxymuconolactone decarboxylase